MSALVVLAALIGVVALIGWSVERSGGGVVETALIAALGAVAAAGRVLFVVVPGVAPVSVICLIGGAALGARAGAAIGAIAALLSNTVLGHGAWTPAQMGLWATIGASGALLRHVVEHRAGLLALAIAWGFLFGWAMNLWFLATFGPEVSVEAFLIASGRSLPFEIAAATGNALIAFAVGAPLHRMLQRAAIRTRVRVAAPAGAERLLVGERTCRRK